MKLLKQYTDDYVAELEALEALEDLEPLKELEALKSIKGTIISSRRGDWKIEYCYVSDIESTKKHFDIIEEALNELEDAKHNYKAIEEMYNNSVAYATKIQKELNELKKRNEPMKVDLAASYDGLLGCFKCPKCGETLRRYYNYCPDCGQKLDWSDEK